MAKSLNKVMLIGNLGKDPELKYTTSGVAIANFSIACNESWKDADGNAQERTEWVNIVAWKKLAEICGEWLKKGKRIYCEGRLQTRSWEKDGKKNYMTEVVIDNMIMLDGKVEGETHERAASVDRNLPTSKPTEEESLPF